MSKLEKVIDVITAIVGFCAIVGGFGFFILCISAIFAGPIVIGTKP